MAKMIYGSLQQILVHTDQGFILSSCQVVLQIQNIDFFDRPSN